MALNQANNLTSITHITSYNYDRVYEMIVKVVEFNIAVHNRIHDDKKDSYFNGVLHKKHCSKYDPRLVFYKDLFIYNKEFYLKHGNSVYKFNEYSYEPLVKVIRLIYKDVNSYDEIIQDDIEGSLFGNHVSFKFIGSNISINWYYYQESLVGSAELIRLDDTTKAKKIFYNNRNEYIKLITTQPLNYLTYPFDSQL